MTFLKFIDQMNFRKVKNIGAAGEQVDNKILFSSGDTGKDVVPGKGQRHGLIVAAYDSFGGLGTALRGFLCRSFLRFNFLLNKIFHIPDL
jgi:hypothetical protein